MIGEIIYINDENGKIEFYLAPSGYVSEKPVQERSPEKFYHSFSYGYYESDIDIFGGVTESDIINGIKNRRDDYLLNSVVTYDGISSYVDLQSWNALTAYVIGHKNNPEDNDTVNWIFNNTENEITIDQAQGLQGAITAFQNKAYKEAFTIINQAANYSTVAEAVIAYETAMEGDL